MLIPQTEPVYDSLQWLATADTAPLRDLRFGRLRLTKPSITYGVDNDTEFALLFLSGTADVTLYHGAHELTWRGVGPGAHTPFGHSGDLVLVPPDYGFAIAPPHGYAVDVAVVAARVTDRKQTISMLVREQDALSVEMHADSGHYVRTVKTYLGDNGPSQRIRLGTTTNSVGSWSSHPLHGFEHLDVQGFEEIFYYAVSNANGEGIQRLKGPYVTGEQVDGAVVVRTGDVCVIPCGLHPVAALPDGRLWYLWAYISNDSRVSKRPPRFLEDRLHV